MPVISLPDEPSLTQLRNQAKDLRRAVRAGAAGALAEVAEFSPAPAPVAETFPLHAAQLVVARRYGFASWARLKRHVEVIERYSRFPDRMTGDGVVSLADEFLRLATPTWLTTSSSTARRRSAWSRPRRSSPPCWPPTGPASTGCAVHIPD